MRSQILSNILPSLKLNDGGSLIRLRSVWPTFKVLLALMTTVAYAQTAIASQQSGQATSLIVRASDGVIYFFLSGNSAGRPSCASKAYWIIKDEKSNAGRQQLALLLAARATGATITVTGSSTCTRWGDGEDVLEIYY